MSVHARLGCRGAWRLERADACRLPFEDESFSLVLATYVLNVLSDEDGTAALRAAELTYSVRSQRPSDVMTEPSRPHHLLERARPSASGVSGPIEDYLAHRTPDKFTRSLCPHCLELVAN